MNRERGFTLIELMISLVLGLIIVGTVIMVFISTYNTYITSQALGRIQENGRFAFELMARDIREAGGLPCGNDLNLANVVNDTPSTWWAHIGSGVHGYEGNEDYDGADFSTSEEGRINGTDAIWISGTSGNAFSVESHNPSAAQFQLNNSDHDFSAGQILLVCDFDQASLFQMSGPTSTNSTVVHNTGSLVPGNCTKGLGYPVECTTNGNAKTYGENSVITHFMSVSWYLGCNGRADCSTPEGRSLYRTEPRNGIIQTDEVVDSVADLQIQYRLEDGDDYEDADDATMAGANSWENVVAVQVALTIARSNVGVGVGGNRADITRTYTHVVALRNHLQ